METRLTKSMEKGLSQLSTSLSRLEAKILHAGKERAAEQDALAVVSQGGGGWERGGGYGRQPRSTLPPTVSTRSSSNDSMATTITAIIVVSSPIVVAPTPTPPPALRSACQQPADAGARQRASCDGTDARRATAQCRGDRALRRTLGKCSTSLAGTDGTARARRRQRSGRRAASLAGTDGTARAIRRQRSGKRA